MPDMPSEVQLRRCEPKDFPALLTLEETIFPEDAFNRRTFQELLREGAESFLVAYAGDTLVGYVAATKVNQHGYIASIGVAEAERRHGLGKRLTDAVAAVLIGQGATLLSLHVRTQNAAAIAFYLKYGFRLRHTLSAYYHDGMDAHLMIMRLPKPTTSD